MSVRPRILCVGGGSDQGGGVLADLERGCEVVRVTDPLRALVRLSDESFDGSSFARFAAPDVDPG